MAPMSRNITSAPEKGVFPLDHFGECKQLAQDYLTCLEKNENEARPCNDLAKRYFECRMDRKLMVKQDLAELGIDGPAFLASVSGRSSGPAHR
ncbi:hypothetical protein CEUSTIGMA_g7942.t1 [Chlamydomonas eustigma]|uniref:CHCH domain-containing protein n=1 Tax=Chlamydomonas eustigma TaxID=1157962 RepID=A0A250XBQ0_9CHLO|nr:hypothetical protein CEUSTIGMA_g7942.t1 [Chlamydomonas eustigma]|eukprot:GAX80504.1 hypothetical protein CEUSTIGMA_g7942.t1 [Chlamydomonas eustigma]